LPPPGAPCRSPDFVSEDNGIGPATEELKYYFPIFPGRSFFAGEPVIEGRDSPPECDGKKAHATP